MRRPEITMFLAQEHIAELRREAEVVRLRSRGGGARRPPPPGGGGHRGARAGAARRRSHHPRPRGARGAPQPDGTVTIRLDRAGDASRLYQLAAQSGARLAPGPFVLAEADGRVVAALPVRGGPAVSDPAERTSDLHALLELRAAQLAARDRGIPRLRTGGAAPRMA